MFLSLRETELLLIRVDPGGRLPGSLSHRNSPSSLSISGNSASRPRFRTFRLVRVVMTLSVAGRMGVCARVDTGNHKG